MSAVLTLLLKLTLAPGLVALATRASRRLGTRTGGLVSGLPVVAGPIVLIYAVQHGSAYARTAAQAAILGIISLAAFCVAYALAARRLPPWLALIAGAASFGACTAAFNEVHPSLAVSVLVTALALIAGALSLKRLSSGPAAVGPRSDLLLWRLAITAALVVALTAVANGLSTHLAGLLVPLPIITGVMAAFTHARAGSAASIALLEGLTEALCSFLAFFGVLVLALPAGAGIAFGLATAAALGAWSLIVVRRGGLGLRRPATDGELAATARRTDEAPSEPLRVADEPVLRPRPGEDRDPVGAVVNDVA